MILSLLIVPYAGLIAGFSIWDGLYFKHAYITTVVGVIVSLAFFPLAYSPLNWLLDRPLFGLHGAKAEGPRRMAILFGWVIGVPATLFIQYRYEYSMGGFTGYDLALSPFFIFWAFLSVYILVHAVFWAIEGFKSE
jgi:hypothetical protein